MKRVVFIALCAVSICASAMDFPISGSTPAPAVSMQSVNSCSYMTTGSSFSSDVYDVGASSPFNAPSAGVRKAPPSIGSGEEADYNPTNPQFSTLGDALAPLLVIALLYAAYIARRRKSRSRVSFS